MIGSLTVAEGRWSVLVGESWGGGSGSVTLMRASRYRDIAMRPLFSMAWPPKELSNCPVGVLGGAVFSGCTLVP